MKITTIRVKEDLKMRLNRLKYTYNYSTIDQVIRHLLEIKTPPLTNAKSIPHSDNPDSFFHTNPNRVVKEEEEEE